MLNYILGGALAVFTSLTGYYAISYYKTLNSLTLCNAALSTALQNAEVLQNAVDFQNESIRKMEVDVEKYKKESSKYKRTIERRYEGVNVGAKDCKGQINAANEILSIYFDK